MKRIIVSMLCLMMVGCFAFNRDEKDGVVEHNGLYYKFDSVTKSCLILSGGHHAPATVECTKEFCDLVHGCN